MTPGCCRVNGLGTTASARHAGHKTNTAPARQPGQGSPRGHVPFAIWIRSSTASGAALVACREFLNLIVTPRCRPADVRILS